MKTDLAECDSPTAVVKALRVTARLYFESAQELESAWQERGVGDIWEFIAKEFERLADKIEKKWR